VSRLKRGNSFTKRTSTGTLPEPAHDSGVTTPADQAISVSTGYSLLTLEIRTMGFRGLPAAKTVEQAILLAQLQILRQMEKTRS
jgi:hypothetical protein